MIKKSTTTPSDDPGGDHVERQRLKGSRMKSRTSCTMEKKSALSAIAALADEHRYDTFMVLLNVGTGGLDASEIADRSHAETGHGDNRLLTEGLAVLVRSNLVWAERNEHKTIYRANEGAYVGLMAFLQEVLTSKF